MLGIVSLAMPDAQTRPFPCPQVGRTAASSGRPHTQDSRLAIGAASPIRPRTPLKVRRVARKDGQGLMQHDNDLAKATDSTGLVSDRTLADIRANTSA